MTVDTSKGSIIETEVKKNTCKATKTVNYKPITKHYKLMGIFELITVILMIAKLTGYTTMSWLWVFLPMFLHVVLVLAIIFVVIVAFVIAVIIAALAS